MSRDNDLPPGCSPSDIPGNRPEDGVAEEVAEVLTKAWSYGFDEADIVALWRDVMNSEEAKADDMARDQEEI